MKIKPEQLHQHLSKQLATLYVVGGPEPLLVEEACDNIKQAALQKGFAHREIITVDTHFDWHRWQQDLKNLSLFSTQRYIELRLPEKLNKTMTDALSHYAQHPEPDTLVVIACDKLDSRSAWVKTIEQCGVVVQIWPVTKEQLPAWLQARLQQYRLSTSKEGLQLLASHLENNLFAAKRTVQQFSLLYGDGAHLSLQQILDCLGQDAKHDVYQWLDALWVGEPAAAINLLRSLQSSDTEPLLLLWVLCKELRQLIHLRFQVDQGQSLASVIQQAAIWPKRKALIQQALLRHSSLQWQSFLNYAYSLEQHLKGLVKGNAWDLFETLSLRLCGKEMIG